MFRKLVSKEGVTNQNPRERKRAFGKEPTPTYSTWMDIATAPKDGTLVLLAYYTRERLVDYEVGMWVLNYGCPGWSAAGTFIDPVAWMPIPMLSSAVISPLQDKGCMTCRQTSRNAQM